MIATAVSIATGALIYWFFKRDGGDLGAGRDSDENLDTNNRRNPANTASNQGDFKNKK